MVKEVHVTYYAVGPKTLLLVGAVALAIAFAVVVGLRVLFNWTRKK